MSSTATASPAITPRVWVPEAIRFATDPICGAEVEQLTSEPVTSTNIYPEQRFTSADGKRIALARYPFSLPPEVWVCDLGNFRLVRVAHGIPISGNPERDAVYFTAGPADDAKLMKVHLHDLTVTELFRFRGPAPTNMAVAPDERCVIFGPFDEGDGMYRLDRADLRTGARVEFCRIQDMFNPHLQFNPDDGRQVVVQINRGGKRNLAKNESRLVGPLGATFSLLDADTGHVTPLPIGRPHTLGISGHECWVGKTGALLFTAGRFKVSTSAFVTLRDATPEDAGKPPTAIYAVRPGDAQARVVADDLLYNHIAASDDGRFFIADDHATGIIHVGSIATGKHLPLCHSHTRQGTCQYSHVHAYMTPDLNYVIFNSIVTGVAQVYAARVPEGFLQQVEALPR